MRDAMLLLPFMNNRGKRRSVGEMFFCHGRGGAVYPGLPHLNLSPRKRNGVTDCHSRMGRFGDSHEYLEQPWLSPKRLIAGWFNDANLVSREPDRSPIVPLG